MVNNDFLMGYGAGKAAGGGGSGGPLITQQPSDVSGEIGVTVHFSVTASGTDLTYKWQSNFYGEWRDTTFSSSTTATLSFKVTQERDGVQYRCKITDGEGRVVYSNPATVRVAVPEPVFITKTITENGTYAASSDNADGYSEVTVDVPSGTIIQAPYKVSSGSIVPVSNTQALHVPLNGITSVTVATLLADDYENYATKYIDKAPIFLRMNHAKNAPLSVGNYSSAGARLNEDGTLSGVANLNGSGISGTDYVFGSYVAGVYFRAGVTYNYVIVGV